MVKCQLCDEEFETDELLQKHKESHYEFADDWYYLKNNRNQKILTQES